MTQQPKHSDNLDKLLPALLKAKQEMGHVTKDKHNPAFKSRYADLAGCLDAGDPKLFENGLLVTHARQFDEKGQEELVTTLWHAESGQWLRSYALLKPVKSDPQGVGSAITYTRRQDYTALIGLAPDDDDGNAASGQGATPAPAARAVSAPAASAPARTSSPSPAGSVSEFISLVNQAMGLDLDEKAANFVREQFQRIEQYGDRLNPPSEKQLEWLRKIVGNAKPAVNIREETARIMNGPPAGHPASVLDDDIIPF